MKFNGDERRYWQKCTKVDNPGTWDITAGFYLNFVQFVSLWKTPLEWISIRPSTSCFVVTRGEKERDIQTVWHAGLGHTPSATYFSLVPLQGGLFRVYKIYQVRTGDRSLWGENQFISQIVAVQQGHGCAGPCCCWFVFQHQCHLQRDPAIFPIQKP